MSNENKDAFSYEKAKKEMIKGCVLGGTVISTVTPFLSWTNLTIEAKNKAIEKAVKDNPKTKTLPKVNIYPLLFNKRVFAGTSAYVCSVAPSTAICVSTNDVLKTYLPETNPSQSIAAFGAGFFAGLISSPFEAVAQTKDLLTHNTKKEIILKTLRVNGVSALMRGAFAVCLREGLWGVAYMAAPDAIGTFFKNNGVDPVNAERLGALTAGTSFGLASCFFKQFQYHKQCGLTTPGAAKSYPEIGKNLWHKVPNASVPRKLSLFFIGGVPRTVASATAAVLLNEGIKYYDECISNQP